MLACGVASAQFSGAVEGYVKDGTGAVIPGAEVVVTDENLGLEREATSNETGFFRIGELPAGSYAASVTSPGFVTWSTTGLLVRSDETRTLYPEMQIGEVTTSITIEADTSAVNTTEVDNTNYIDEESLKNQPLPRNTIWQLSTLVPRVTGTGETSATNGAFVDNYQGEMGLRINASGQRQGANLVMLNGSYAEVPSRDVHGKSDSRLSTGVPCRSSEFLRGQGKVFRCVPRVGNQVRYERTPWDGGLFVHQ